MKPESLAEALSALRERSRDSGWWAALEEAAHRGTLARS